MRSVVAIRMAALLWSYYFQHFAVSLSFLSAPALRKRMNVRTGCHSQWASSAQPWNAHGASHTWTGSLALRLCVCLISSWVGAQFMLHLQGWTKPDSLNPSHCVEICHWGMGALWEGNALQHVLERTEETLQWSWRRLALLGSCFLCLCTDVLDCSCIMDKERNLRVWWQNESWVKIHKRFCSCCETTCSRFSSRQLLAWGRFAPQVLFNVIMCYGCFCWFV